MPRHGMPSTSRNEDSTWRWMAWRARLACPRPTQVDFGILATPPPILGEFGQVESDFWVLLLIRRTLFWVEVMYGKEFMLEGQFAHTIYTSDSPI